MTGIDDYGRAMERARLLDEARQAGVLPSPDIMRRYTFELLNPLHPDYSAVCEAREWTPGTGRCVYIWGSCRLESVGLTLLNAALDKLYSVACYEAIDLRDLDSAPREIRTAAALLLHWIDAACWQDPERIEPIIELLSARRDMGKVTIVTARVPPEQLVGVWDSPALQAAKTAILECLNTEVGDPLVLHLGG
ncbi:MAG: hypothetical protein PHW14_03865 [Candidatus Omnitrophica bacterium]|nr:hypothetical protein [Candidatus Omnitrophota bacterium]